MTQWQLQFDYQLTFAYSRQLQFDYQLTFACSKSTIEALEKSVKYVEN